MGESEWFQKNNQGAPFSRKNTDALHHTMGLFLNNPLSAKNTVNGKIHSVQLTYKIS